MRKTPSIALLLAPLAALPLLAGSAAPPESAWRADGALHEAMETLQANVRKLSKAVEAEDFEALRATVLKMQAAVHEAKQHEPDEVAQIRDEKERAKELTGFRKKLVELDRALLTLEEAGLDADAGAAGRAIDALQSIKKDGHAKYKGD